MMDVETEPPGKAKGTCGKYLNKLKLSELVKRTKRHPTEDRKSKHHACPSAEDNRPPAGEEVLSFEEKLKQGLLEEACRELLCREEQLFGAPPGSCQQDEEQVDRLHRDNELLLLHLWTAVHDSFSPLGGGGGGGADRLEALRRAVRVVQRQEEHDALWGERRRRGGGGAEEEEAPAWRPHRCLNTHDTLLRSTVESRLKTAAEDVSLASDVLSSPLKREVCQVGRRLKEDLLTVVRDIRWCYPEDMDVVNLYAGLYHQVFSSRLTQRVHSAALEPDDCGYLLVWVNHIYHEDILGHVELCAHIDTHTLGTLLPADDHTLLEEQYLTHKQDQVNSWVSTALKQEVEHWQSGRSLEMIDSYCFSPLAVLVLEAVNSSVTEARCVLREHSHTHRITAQLHCFLMSYKSRLEEFVKEKHPNCPNVMKANLVCVKQFRDYVEQTAVCLPEEVKTSCLAALSELEDCCYGYFTCPVHLELKVWYRQLWTQGWMQDGEKVVDGLLSLLHEHLSHLSDIKPTCMEVLVSRLHAAVSVEYVRRMMKRKLRMKSRQEQETAARLTLDDAHNLNLYFTDQGSRETGVSAVLSRLAEVIRLQDPGSIQLEVATLARDYPDLSARHVSALLSVKSTLSSADLRSIKLSVEEVRPSLSSTNHSLPFFSKVTVKGTGKLGIKT